MSALAVAAPVQASTSNGLQPIGCWPRTALQWLDTEPAVVRVVIASLRGSVPRGVGACMLVTRSGIAGTVGGGHLEWQAMIDARKLLDAEPGSGVIKRYVLGIELGQCCGGVVELWFERLDRGDDSLLRLLATTIEQSMPASLESRLEHGRITRTLRHTAEREAIRRLRHADGSDGLIERLDTEASPLWIFGAGHVAQALVRMLDGLPFAVSWMDSRAELFPSSTPATVRIHCPASPATMIEKAAAGTHFLVLTHDHQLDYALCRTVLDRGDAASLGVIGSDSKAARFRSRLARDGYTPEQAGSMRCPVGIAGIASKQPAAIAVSILAQLLQSSAAAIRPRAPLAAHEDCAVGSNPDACTGCNSQLIKPRNG